MPLPFPAEWTARPPRFIVAGEGVYARVLAQVLGDAVLVTDEMLREGIAPPLNESPLCENLETVILILGNGESTDSLLWRHRRTWMLPGHTTNLTGHPWYLDEGRWLFLAADEKQKEAISELDVLGRSPASSPFKNWKCGLLAREAGLLAILAKMNALEPIPTSDWISVVNQDQAAAAIRGFQKFLSQPNDFMDVARQLPLLQSFVPSLTWEQHFPPPQHRWGNRMRNWLAVTVPATQWLEEGRILFSELQP